jgi:hypothetical protein
MNQLTERMQSAYTAWREERLFVFAVLITDGDMGQSRFLENLDLALKKARTHLARAGLSPEAQITLGESELKLALHPTYRVWKPKTLVAVLWRLTNLVEWLQLPNRQHFITVTPFSRETWDAISIQQAPHVLKQLTVEPFPQQVDTVPDEAAPDEADED